MLRVSELYIYPIKSLGGVQVENARLTDRGFENDRRWMLVEENNVFLSQREIAEMALLKINMLADGFEVYHVKDPKQRIFISYISSAIQRSRVTIWNDECEAISMDSAINNWFSSMLSINCKLVYMPEDVNRFVDRKYAHNNELSSFSDDYPLLMIGQASLDDLNSKLAQPVPMNRFRPNIVFTGGEAFQEDEMHQFFINDISFACVKPCARCIITTIDQQTAIKSKEPLKTLSTYRTQNNKVMFGQNVLYKGMGIIYIGDEIKLF